VGKSNGQLCKNFQIGVAKEEESILANNKTINKESVIKNKTRLIKQSQIEGPQITEIMR
jgi:hypothetical protein